MEAYRLTRAAFASTLSGAGAALKGGRWNSVGVEMIYTAKNRSLAMAEVAVHLTLATLPDDYKMVTLFLPDTLSMQTIHVRDLPKGWNLFPPGAATQKIGDLFIQQNQHCLLQVPSAVTAGDHNLLINPRHEDFGKIKIVSIDNFPFDRRIIMR